MRFQYVFIVLGAVFFVRGAAFADSSQYTLNPGDVLEVTVWKEDGLDREVLVLPDGGISFPLIGSVSTTGKTPAVLEAEIKKRISGYIPDASVSVAVKAALGNVISVVGQVNKPGELIVGHRTSVIQALSIAGGLTPYASTSNIIILHREGDKEISTPFDYDDVSRGRGLETDVILTPGDVIVVPNASLF